MAIAEEPVLVERDGELATVILNRPAKLNAINREMARRLADEMNALAADVSVKCVLVRGSGKAFCPGADIGEFGAQRASREEAEAFATYFHGALDAVVQCPHPIVAIIRGACVGGGLQLAALCDLRIASESARFGIPVNRIWADRRLQRAGADLSSDRRGTAARNPAGRARVRRCGGAWEGAREPGRARRPARSRSDADGAAHRRRRAARRPLAQEVRAPPRRSASDFDEEMRDECFVCFDTEDFRTGYAAFLEQAQTRLRGTVTMAGGNGGNGEVNESRVPSPACA